MLCQVLRVASHAKSSEKKNLNKTLLRTPWGIKSGSIPKKVVQDYLMSISNIDLLVGVAKTNVNQVLGLPLTVSTRRVEPKTSKATILEEVSVLAKS